MEPLRRYVDPSAIVVDNAALLEGLNAEHIRDARLNTAVLAAAAGAGAAAERLWPDDPDGKPAFWVTGEVGAAKAAILDAILGAVTVLTLDEARAGEWPLAGPVDPDQTF